MRTASLDRSSFVCQSEALTDTYIAKKKDNHFKKLQHDAQQARDCQQAVDELHRAPPGLAGAGRDSRVAADQLASDVENLADIYAFGGQKSAACAEQNLARLRDGYRRRKGGSSSVDARVAAAAALSGGLPPPPPDATVPARERLGPLKALIKAGTEHAATARSARVRNIRESPLRLRGPSSAAGGRLAQHGVVPTVDLDGSARDGEPLARRVRHQTAEELADTFTKEFGASNQQLHAVVRGVMSAQGITGTVAVLGGVSVGSLMALFTPALEAADLNMVGHVAALTSFFTACRNAGAPTIE